MRKGVRRLVNDVPKVLAAQNEKAVHDLRVCSRRLQQILIAMFGGSPPKKARAMRRLLRGTRRALGAWRNRDVVIGALERRERRARSEERRQAWAMVRETALAERKREIRRARKRLMKLNVFSLAETAEDLIESAGRQGAATDASFWASVEAAWKDWKTAHERALQSLRQDDIHAFRITTKRMRYRVEVARELGTGGTDALLNWFKRLQNGLGRWRDRIELSAIIARAIANPDVLMQNSRASIILLTELERLARRAEHDLGEELRAINGSSDLAGCEAWVRAPLESLAAPAAAAQALPIPPGAESVR